MMKVWTVGKAGALFSSVCRRVHLVDVGGSDMKRSHSVVQRRAAHYNNSTIMHIHSTESVCPCVRVALACACAWRGIPGNGVFTHAHIKFAGEGLE